MKKILAVFLSLLLLLIVAVNYVALSADEGTVTISDYIRNDKTGDILFMGEYAFVE